VFRLLAFAAIGTGLGGMVVALADLRSPGDGLTIVAISFAAFMTFGMMTLFARDMSGMVVPSAATLQEARDARRFGVARIVSLRETGTRVNERPVCQIELVVQPLSGSAWATTVTQTVGLAELSALQPGVERPVLVLLDGGPEVVFADGELSPSVLRTVRVPDRAAVPFVPPEPHTRIVHGRRRGPIIGVGRRGRAGRIALFTVVAVIAGAAVVMPFRAQVASTATAVAVGDWQAVFGQREVTTPPRVDLRRPAALRAAMAALTKRIGHDQVVSVYVTADLIDVEAPVEPGSRRTDEWYYRDGKVEHEGAATIQPTLAAEQFPSSVIATDDVWSMLRRGSEDAGKPVGDASVSVSRDTDGDVDSDTFGQPVAAPVLRFTIEDDYEQTFFEAAPDGTGLRSTGTR
jgi:hypothetical protein